MFDIKVHSDHTYLSGSHRERVRTFRVRVLMGKEIVLERNYHEPHYFPILGYDGVARGQNDAKQQVEKHLIQKMKSILN